MQMECRGRTVLVATDVRLIHDSLEWAIGRRGGYSIVGAANSSQELLRLAALLKPDLVIAEWAIARSAGLVSAITRASASTRTVAFGVANAVEEILACAEAGVSGYVLRNAGMEETFHALDAALRGEVMCPPAIVACAFERIANLAADRNSFAPRHRLPDRQSQILALIEEGLSNKEIAVRLGIELSTVKNHVHSLLIKIGVRTRSEAVAKYRQAQSRAR
jgi:two-component system, NarL family, nitrate/nitrite response regulator NarL